MISLSCLLYTVNPESPHVSPENGSNSQNTSIPTPNWDAIPPELKAETRWILWQAKPNPENHKVGKVPLDPRNGRKASAMDREIWLTFDQVRLDFEQTTKADGVGFVLGDGWAGVDLDDCVAKDGTLTRKAAALISRLHSYTEISPSQTGVKIFVKGKKPGTRCERNGIEMYDGNRFFTVTGSHLFGTPPTVENRTAELDALYREVFEEKSARTNGEPGNNHRQEINEDDVAVLNMLMNAANGDKFRRLYSGDWGDYPSESEADCALLAMLLWGTQHDEAQATRLFEGSPFFAQKDDDHRRKWERDDYRQRTIAKALEGLGKYDPNSFKHSNNGSQKKRGNNGKQKEAKESTGGSEQAQASQKPATDWIPYSDTYTADRVVFLHGKDIRWCDVWQRWLVWDGIRWTFDDTQQVKRFVEETIRRMIPEAMEMDTDAAQKFLSYIKGALGQNRIEGVTRALQRKVPILPSYMDTDPMLLNCLDGTIDLRTGKLREHRRLDYITKVCPVRIKTAENPNASDVLLFENFITRILPDPELRAFVQRAIGYSITGSAKEEVLFFPYGPTATGKSTLLAAVQAALGDYAATADFETLLADAKASGRPKTELARLAGKRFVVSVEVNKGVRLAEGLLKWITGQDQVVARFLYGNEFEFLPSFTLWLAANHRPKATDDDDALWRRILQMPFSSQIPPLERDPTIKERLRDPEQFGAIVLAWAVKGCLEWQKQGLGVPEAVERTTAEYRQEMNPIGDFIEDCCVVDSEAYATSGTLWDAYQEWASENGIKFPLMRRAFADRLKAMGFVNDQRRVHGVVKRVWVGIGIATEAECTAVPYRTTTFGNFSKDPLHEEKLSDHAVHAVHAVHLDDPAEDSPPSERGQGESEAHFADDHHEAENTGEGLTREQKIVHIHDAEDWMGRPRTDIDSSWSDEQISTVYNMRLDLVTARWNAGGNGKRMRQ